MTVTEPERRTEGLSYPPRLTGTTSYSVDYAQPEVQPLRVVNRGSPSICREQLAVPPFLPVSLPDGSIFANGDLKSE